MNLKAVSCVTAIILGMLTFNSIAQWHAPDLQDPSSPEDIQKALSGGVPSGRWKEGLHNPPSR